MKALAKLFIIAATLLAPVSFSSIVFADCSSSTLTTQQAIQCGTDNAAGQSGNQDAGSTLDTTIKNIIDVISTLIGITAVIMIIIAGFRFVSSAGNPESAKAARSTITYAIIGLLVVAVAQVIVRFTLNTVTPDCVNGKTSTGQAC